MISKKALCGPADNTLRSSIVLALLVVVVTTLGCSSDPHGDVDDIFDHERILDDTSRLTPGYFTRFEDGLLIGPHPYIFDEIVATYASEDIDLSPVTEGLAVEVQRLDPASLSEFPPKNEDVRDFDLAVEITATEIEADHAVVAPVDTTFYTAIPVPDRFDKSRLAAAIYVYEGIEDANGVHDFEESWEFEPAQGLYDPDTNLFLVETPFIGGADVPARVILTEHATRETDPYDPTLRQILDTFFPALEEQRQLRASPNALHEPGHQVLFDVDCKFSGNEAGHSCSCIQWSNMVESALESALLYYKQLEGSPRPDLSTTKSSKLNSFLTSLPFGEKIPGVSEPYTEYIYKIRDSATSTRCDGRNGQYRWGFGVSGTARTCAQSPHPKRTTRHEFFHAFQSDYSGKEKAWPRGPVIGRDTRRTLWIIEATARVAESIGSDDHPEEFDVWTRTDPGKVDCHNTELFRADLRPLDVGLMYDDFDRNVDPYGGNPAYSAEAFWADLLYRTTGPTDTPDSLAALRELGNLFSIGHAPKHVHEFIEDFTPFDSLRDAHWQWVKNAAFEGNLTFPDGTYAHRCSPEYDHFFYAEPTLTIPHDGALHLPAMDNYSARLVEIEIEDADPDLAEYYKISWAAGNGQLYTDSMERGNGTACVDIAGQHLTVTEEVPGVESAGSNSSYLINTSTGGVTAYLLLQDSPSILQEMVTVTGPHPHPSHVLEFYSTSPDGGAIISENASPEAGVSVTSSEPIVNYEWILDRAPLDEDIEDKVTIASGPDVTSIKANDFIDIDTCPSVFEGADGMFGDIGVMELSVRVRDALGAEIVHQWPILVEQTIISGEVTGLRIVPPDDDVDLFGRIWNLVTLLPFYKDENDYDGDVEAPSPIDDVWPIGRKAVITDSEVWSQTHGFPINVSYDHQAPYQVSFRDEMYDWGVALHATASRCEAVPPELQPNPDCLELRIAGGDWKRPWSGNDSCAEEEVEEEEEELAPPIFDSSVFDISDHEYLRNYSQVRVDIRHIEMAGQVSVWLPPPCFMYRNLGMNGELENMAPEPTVGDASDYAECLHPADKKDIFDEFQSFHEQAIFCAGQQIGTPGLEPLALQFDPCLPFDDMPDVTGWDWEDTLMPPNYDMLGGGWCAGMDGDEALCWAGTERINHLRGIGFSDQIGEAYLHLRNSGGVNASITPGKPDAMFVFLNVIAGNIVDNFAPLGEGWDQLANTTGDNRFLAVGHQASVAPLEYGVVAGVYAAAAWAPMLMEGTLAFDEYVSHITDAAATGSVLGALHAFDDHYDL